MADTPGSRAPALRVVISTFLALTALTTVLRVYTRLRIAKLFGADDYWMLLAMVSFLNLPSPGIGLTA